MASWEIEEPSLKNLINPCGQIVDVVRGLYRTKMRLFRDDPREVNVLWYPAPDGAKPIPFWHRYASQIWMRDKEPDWTGPGEIKGADRTFVFPRNPPFYLGQCHIGSEDWWQNGVPVSALDDPIPDPPDCCYAPAPTFDELHPVGVTIWVTGHHRVGPPDFSFTITTWTEGAASECESYNGVPFVLHPSFSPGHAWWYSDYFLLGGSMHRWLMRDNAGTVELLIEGVAANLRGTNTDPTYGTPIVLYHIPFTPSFFCGSWPTMLTVYPDLS